MTKGIKKLTLSGAGLRIGIVASRWNEQITDTLLDRCRQALLDSGVREKDIFVIRTPGSFELPFAAKQLAKKKKCDAVVALGCLIKGETMHFEYIAGAVSQGIMQVGFDTGVPIIFGVLVCLSQEQANIRADKEGMDHGYEWGLSAVEMGLLA